MLRLARLLQFSLDQLELIVYLCLDQSIKLCNGNIRGLANVPAGSFNVYLDVCARMSLGYYLIALRLILSPIYSSS